MRARQFASNVIGGLIVASSLRTATRNLARAGARSLISRRGHEIGMLQGGFASARFVFSDGTWLMIR
jgi:hypothetical protein